MASTERAPEIIDSFSGSYRFLSNFYTCVTGVELDRVQYRTIEHAYQAAKTMDLVQRNRIRETSSPGMAKQLGRKVTLRADWEKVKVDIMHDLLRQKFGRDPILAGALAGTRDAQLVEGNYWGDREWGVCRGKGKNLLGKLLMQVREEIQRGEL